MSNLALSDETAIAPTDVFLDGTSITEIQLAEDCRNLVDELNRTGNSLPIEQAITNLNGVEQFAAKAKSKLIYEYSKWYKQQFGAGSDFAEYFTQKFGGNKLTVQKHQAKGELLMNDAVPDGVKLLNSGELVSVARAMQSGYDLSGHWDEIETAGSEEEINAIVRKVKGKPERQGTLSISVQPDGSITGWMGDVMVSLGWLNYADRDSDDTPPDKKKVLEIGIARIIHNGRMKIK
jgi:hypothetical protein